MKTDSITIGDRSIGPGNPCYIIAEAGVNHNGDMAIAHALIDAAREAGADAVKFQCFDTAAVISPSAEKAPYQKRGPDDRETQFEMVKPLELTPEQLTGLSRHCRRTGIQFLCTPYDHGSVSVLERIGVAAFKVASTDTNNIPFLRHIAAKGRPLLLSTGMSTLEEIAQSVAAIEATGNTAVALMQCTTQYPAPPADLNIGAIATLGRRFQMPVGFSDHSEGIDAASWAVAAGACIIEKHFTMDRTMTGPDHAASIEPEALRRLVSTVRRVEAAMGDGVKRVLACELENKRVMQKSVVAARDIPAGTVICAEDLTTRRPGTGLAPKWLERLIGAVAVRSIGSGEMVTRESIPVADAH